MESEVVGFLFILNDNFSVALSMVRSRKFSFLSFCRSIVKCKLGVMLLKDSRIFSMLVEFSL